MVASESMLKFKNENQTRGFEESFRNKMRFALEELSSCYSSWFSRKSDLVFKTKESVITSNEKDDVFARGRGDLREITVTKLSSVTHNLEYISLYIREASARVFK